MKTNNKIFIGIPEFSDYEKAKVVILPVPYEGTVSYGKGTAKGPEAIIAASSQVELFDNEINKNITCNDPKETVWIHTLPALKIKKNEDPAKVVKLVQDACKKELSSNKFIVMLGGEHSISSGFFNALLEKYPKLSVIQIDAHADLREEYDGTRFSHASVMARIRDKCDKVVQVGIRAYCDEEYEKIKKNSYKVFFAKDICGNNKENNNDKWIKEAMKNLGDNVFITIDVDGFDPSVIPHTGTPVPGGLKWYQTLKLLKEVFKNKNVVGFDVVELAPDENSQRSDFACSQLVYKLIGYKFFKENI